MTEPKWTIGRSKPPVIAVGGLVASGKSSVSRALCERLDAVRIESDQLQRERLEKGDRIGEGAEVGDGGESPIHEADWGRVFGKRAEDELYRELLRRAEAELADGRAVVLDGCFARAHQRLEARAVALAHDRDFLFVECCVPLEVSRQRLLARNAEGDTSGWQVLFDGLRERWEAVSELASREHAVVYSEGPIDDVLVPIEARLRSPLSEPTTQSRFAASTVSAERHLVTFDCWNTLLSEKNWPVAHRLRVEELRRAALEAGREIPHGEAERAFDAAWGRHMEAWTEGIATGAQDIAKQGLAELGLEDAHPALEHLTRIFEEASHSSDVRALEGARETLDALERAGVPCALVCDTGLTPGRVVRRHLDREGLLSALIVQSFSDEVGAPKPDARTFAAALDPLGIAPERALHVGDLRRTDVAGARALGMTSIRIRQLYDDDPSHDAGGADESNDWAEADHVVDSHVDLLRLFTRLGILD